MNNPGSFHSSLSGLWNQPVSRAPVPPFRPLHRPRRSAALAALAASLRGGAGAVPLGPDLGPAGAGDWPGPRGLERRVATPRRWSSWVGRIASSFFLGGGSLPPTCFWWWFLKEAKKRKTTCSSSSSSSSSSSFFGLGLRGGVLKTGVSLPYSRLWVFFGGGCFCWGWLKLDQDT